MAVGEVGVVSVTHGEDEMRFSVPELGYLPLEAGILHRTDGSQDSLRGWAGRLWIELRDGPRGFTGQPLDLDGFGRAFARSRFEGLGYPGTDGGVIQEPAILAVMDGALHARVPNPVLYLTEGEAGVGVGVAFPVRADAFGWRTFRADRFGDADAFARRVARARGVGLDPSGDRLCPVFPLPRFDDVHLAFRDAFGQIPDGTEIPARKAERIAALTKGRDRFDEPGEAEECLDLVISVTDILRRHGDAGAVSALATLDAVVGRYVSVDRAWMAERDRAPPFAA